MQCEAESGDIHGVGYHGPNLEGPSADKKMIDIAGVQRAVEKACDLITSRENALCLPG